MNPSENEVLVRDAFNAWVEGDVSAFFAIVHQDVRWTITGASPVSGEFRGKQAFLERAVLPVFNRLASPMRPCLRGLTANGDCVVLQWDGQAETKTGAPYFNEFCWVLRIEDRAVVECTAYFCTVRAVGLLS